MKREFLRGLGVSDEHIQAILDEHHDSLRQYKEKAESADSLQAQLDTASAELKSRGEQIEQLQSSVGNNDELKQELENMKAANAEYEDKLKKTQLNNAIKLAVAKEANDANDVLTLLNKDQLELSEDGTVKGLEDAINTLKESKPYLFTPVKPKGYTPPEGGNPRLSKQEIMNIKDPAERQKLIKENIQIFN